MTWAMATSPKYDTGFFSTPGDLLTDANRVNEQVMALDAAIDGNNAIPQDWWDAFQAFKTDWLHFFSSTFGGHGFQQGPSGTSTSAYGAWLTSDLAGQLQSYEAQTASWATQAKQWGVNIAGGVIQPNDDASQAEGILSGIALVVVLLIVLFVVKK